MHRKKLPSLTDVCKNTNRIVILENVMNPTNVGAIFRSAAALNMDAILYFKFHGLLLITQFHGRKMVSDN